MLNVKNIYYFEFKESYREITSKSVILIDVEGFELEVLLGAQNILGPKDKPVIMLESFFDYLEQKL